MCYQIITNRRSKFPIVGYTKVLFLYLPFYNIDMYLVILEAALYPRCNISAVIAFFHSLKQANILIRAIDVRLDRKVKVPRTWF